MDDRNKVKHMIKVILPMPISCTFATSKFSLKSIVSIALLLSFLMVNMSQSIIFVHFELNKNEIAQKYCENKDKPQMHCCGKCQLKKKLAMQEEQQKSPAFPDIKTDIQLYYSQAFLSVPMQDNFTVEIFPATASLQSLPGGKSLFHPPSLA